MEMNIVLGKSEKDVEITLRSMLIAGTTGSGVSNLLARVIDSVYAECGWLDHIMYVSQNGLQSHQLMDVKEGISISRAESLDEIIYKLHRLVVDRENEQMRDCDSVILCIEEIHRCLRASADRASLISKLEYIVRHGEEVNVFIIASSQSCRSLLAQTVEAFQTRLCCRCNSDVSFIMLNSDVAAQIKEKAGYAYKYEVSEEAPVKFKYV